MANETKAQQVERRFFSEALMAELAEALIEQGVATRDQISDLNAQRALTSESLDRLIVREKIIPEEQLMAIMSRLTGIPYHRVAEFNIDQTVAIKVPARVAIRYQIIPVDFRNGVMTLATYRVPTAAASDELRMILNSAVDWVLCTEPDITKSIKYFYGLGAETIDSLVGNSVDTVEVEGRDISVESADPGVVKFLNQIIAEAIRMDATDIHVEPFENSVRVRYRIDGLLQEIPIPKGASQLRRSLASCVKIMADMNIAERRKPHDGRIKVKCGSEEFDLRVSILPTAFGETIALRILNRKTMFIPLEELGLTQNQIPHIQYLSAMPHGVVLLTGPTGSGKTTTLYAILSRLNTTDVKIITVEDPIEYRMPGISQIQTHSQIGLTFANILRSILRHDPDIVLIGEIRDLETADIAVRASLTGHLVFSTLHTNDAPSAITRLVDMGVEPFLVSSCLEGVIAQRLVRRLCNACKQEVTPDESILEEIKAMFPERASGAVFHKGRGCPECHFTGYRGRIAIFEIMVMDDTIRGMVVRQRPSNEIKRVAMEHGLVPLRGDGWLKAMDGVTSFDEVVRVARKIEMPGA